MVASNLRTGRKNINWNTLLRGKLPSKSRGWNGENCDDDVSCGISKYYCCFAVNTVRRERDDITPEERRRKLSGEQKTWNCDKLLCVRVGGLCASLGMKCAEERNGIQFGSSSRFRYISGRVIGIWIGKSVCGKFGRFSLSFVKHKIQKLLFDIHGLSSAS